MIIRTLFWLEKTSGFVSKMDPLSYLPVEGRGLLAQCADILCHPPRGLQLKRQEHGVGLLFGALYEVVHVAPRQKNEFL